MKNTSMFLTAAALAVLWASPASAVFVIDGNVSDWGINLGASNYQGYLNTHLPTGINDVDYVTEDFVDPNTGYVGPGYGGQTYDAEAFYMDNDMNYLYFAIITGLPQNGPQFPTGDIFFDLGYYQDPISPYFADNKYAFAVDAFTGNFYSVNSWQDVLYASHSSSNPWRMGSDKTLIGSIEYMYSSNPVNDHYVIEGKIPLAFFSLNGQDDHDVWGHWTMQCGNDVLDILGDVNSVNTVPEPATMSLLLTGMAGMGFIRRKKSTC